jgi:Leucine-rich repeat (LRR) protein
LSRLPKLQSLLLKNCRVWSGCFRTLTQITRLTLCNCQLSNANIQDVSTLCRLKRLNLSVASTLGRDFTPLAALKLQKLKVARASDVQLSDMCNSGLEILDVSHSHLIDLHWMAKLTNLKKVDLSHSAFVLDLTPLLQLKHLSDIYACKTQFTVVSYFRMATRVKFHF